MVASNLSRMVGSGRVGFAMLRQATTTPPSSNDTMKNDQVVSETMSEGSAASGSRGSTPETTPGSETKGGDLLFLFEEPEHDKVEIASPGVDKGCVESPTTVDEVAEGRPAYFLDTITVPKSSAVCVIQSDGGMHTETESTANKEKNPKAVDGRSKKSAKKELGSGKKDALIKVKGARVIRGQRSGDSDVKIQGKEVVVQMTAKGRDLIDWMVIQRLSNGAACVHTKRQDRSSCRAKILHTLLSEAEAEAAKLPPLPTYSEAVEKGGMHHVRVNIGCKTTEGLDGISLLHRLERLHSICPLGLYQNPGGAINTLVCGSLLRAKEAPASPASEQGQQQDEHAACPQPVTAPMLQEPHHVQDDDIPYFEDASKTGGEGPCYGLCLNRVQGDDGREEESAIRTDADASVLAHYTTDQLIDEIRRSEISPLSPRRDNPPSYCGGVDTPPTNTLSAGGVWSFHASSSTQDEPGKAEMYTRTVDAVASRGKRPGPPQERMKNTQKVARKQKAACESWSVRGMAAAQGSGRMRVGVPEVIGGGEDEIVKNILQDEIMLDSLLRGSAVEEMQEDVQGAAQDLRDVIDSPDEGSPEADDENDAVYSLLRGGGAQDDYEYGTGSRIPMGWLLSSSESKVPDSYDTIGHFMRH